MYAITQIDNSASLRERQSKRQQIDKANRVCVCVFTRERKRQSQATKDTNLTMNTMANTTLEEGELEQSICSVAEKSWYEECEQANHKMTVSSFRF